MRYQFNTYLMSKYVTYECYVYDILRSLTLRVSTSLRKCFGDNFKSSSRVVSLASARSLEILSHGPRKYSKLTGSSFINHLSCVLGRDLDEVQFTTSLSPTWYSLFSSDSRGPLLGRTRRSDQYYRDLISHHSK